MNASFLWLSTEQEFGIALPDEAKWSLIRNHRNGLLAACDWTQLPDAALTLDEKQAWSVHRQDLRNLPGNFTIPDEVVFPEPPGGVV